MEQSAVMTAAEAQSAAARTVVKALINAEFLRFTEPELLSLATTIEGVARLVFTAQVRIAGAIDTRNMAQAHGATSTTALLRQTLKHPGFDAPFVTSERPVGPH